MALFSGKSTRPHRCVPPPCCSGRSSDTAWNHDLNWKVRLVERVAPSTASFVCVACAHSSLSIAQNRCKLEKEEMAAREASNARLREERKQEQRERTRKLAQTRFGVTGTLIDRGALDSYRSDLSTERSGASSYYPEASARQSERRSGRGSARSTVRPSARASARASARSGVAATGRSVGSRATGVTTASERRQLDELRAKFERENARKAEAEDKVKELEAQLQALQSSLSAR